MKVDLLLVVDHLARPCGVRTTYLKLFEWCASNNVSIALISDTDEELPFQSIKCRLNILVDDSSKIAEIKRRPFLSLINDHELVHPDLVYHGISYKDAFYLDAWNGDREWFGDAERKCRQFVDSIDAKQILVATQSFLGFAMAFVLGRENVSICLHTHYAAFYAIRIAGAENDLFHVLENKIMERLKQVIIKSAKNVFLVSPASKRFFHLNGESNIQIFTPGVDTVLFKPIEKPARRSFRCLYAGRWSKDKGTGTFVELFNRVPDVNWIVIGNEADTKLPPNVQGLGTLDQHALAREIGLSDVVIFYGKWDTFGLVALEALSCGVPVLAHAESEISRIIEDKCGFSFRTVDELIGLVQILMAEKHNLKEMRSEARRTAESMTWSRSIETLMEKMNIG